MTASLLEHFSSLDDPRVDRNKAHALIDIIVLTASAVASGADGWQAIEDFGNEKLDWLRQEHEPVNARPEIGKKKVDAITTENILAILSPVWTTKTETAKRVQGRIENVLDYATAHKYRDPLNPARWRGHLDKLLPKPTRVKKVTHHTAMPHTEVPAFMAELSGNGSVSALALRFLILTATRTSEVLQAQWQEIDLVYLVTNTSVWMVTGVTTYPMASAPASATGPARSPASRETWRRWLWPTSSKTRWKLPTGAVTCSPSAAR